MVKTITEEVRTSGQGDAHDITPLVSSAVQRSGLTSGTAIVLVVGSTAGITTLEYEPGVVQDLNRVFEQLAPRRGEYRHHLRWGDDNGSSHVRAALLGPSIAVPFTGGSLLLGTWQQIVLIELDTRGRTRTVVVQTLGSRLDSAD